MALELNGTTGVSLVQDGVVTAADLASGAITSAALPAGSVLQVVQGTSATSTHSNTSSYFAVGIEATITPSSTSSKILVLLNTNAMIFSNGSGSSKIVRQINGTGDTDVAIRTEQVHANVSTWMDSEIGYNLLDEPNTTGACKYILKLATSTGGDYRVISSTGSFSNSNLKSAGITLMEIAG